jgi:hypothetical protein
MRKDDRSITMNSNKCPFCGFGRKSNFEYSCGTSGPFVDDCGEEYFNTGQECDLNVYRTRFLECHDLLVKLVDNAIPMSFKQDGVQIPLGLWREVHEQIKKQS